MWMAPRLARPVRAGSRRACSGSMNTETAARPSEYTTWPTGFDSPMRRVSSTTLWKPGSSDDRLQPARRVGAASASSTRQWAGALRGFTMSGAAALPLPPLAFRQIAAHRVLGANQLARHAVEPLEALGVGRREARDARGFAAPAVLVHEGPAIGKVARRVLDLAQPRQAFGG